MANFCEYHVIIRGKKNNCYAFAGALPLLEAPVFEREVDYGDYFEIWISASCKWTVRAYLNEPNDLFVEVPEDPQEAYVYGVNNLNGVSYTALTKKLDLDVRFAECDIDDYYGVVQYHFNKGTEEYDWSDEPFLSLDEIKEMYGLSDEDLFDEYDFEEED